MTVTSIDKTTDIILPVMTADVAARFETCPEPVRQAVLDTRALIFETAASLPAVGRIVEVLKWQEPAYTTPDSKSGSPFRLGWKAAQPDRFGLYFICTTRLVDRFRGAFGPVLRYEGNRAIILTATDDIRALPIASCITAALTYHADKKGRR